MDMDSTVDGEDGIAAPAERRRVETRVSRDGSFDLIGPELWVEILFICLQQEALGVNELATLERVARRFSRAATEEAACRYVKEYEASRAPGWGGSLRVSPRSGAELQLRQKQRRRERWRERQWQVSREELAFTDDNMFGWQKEDKASTGAAEPQRPSDDGGDDTDPMVPLAQCGAGSLWECPSGARRADSELCTPGRERWPSVLEELHMLDGFRLMLTDGQVVRRESELSFIDAPVSFSGVLSNEVTVRGPAGRGVAIAGPNVRMRAGIHAVQFTIVGPTPETVYLLVGVVQADYKAATPGSASMTGEGWGWSSLGPLEHAGSMSYDVSPIEGQDRMYRQGSTIGLQLDLDRGTLTAIKVAGADRVAVATLCTGLLDHRFERGSRESRAELCWMVEMSRPGTAVRIERAPILSREAIDLLVRKEEQEQEDEDEFGSDASEDDEALLNDALGNDNMFGWQKDDRSLR